ncbi:adhesin [Shewanella sp. 1CM18E]|uniref:T1SS-143 repeat domain-containing protein n=1 Tax=Shewanella sp. 1CM18E TaxID=2929169 RepID=UPI0020BEFFFA|nr:adhesin [Shewanella sp. 1CM18E]MCK8045002.1 adhesin [Shewanella sp. 1CM18E]
MTTLGAVVIYYVKLDDTYWAVTADGQWVMILPHQLQTDIPVHNLQSEAIQVDDNGSEYSFIDGIKVIIPQNVTQLSTIENNADQQEQDQQDSRNQSDSASEQQEGLNLIYQVVQSDNDSVIADSGFATQGDQLTSQGNNQFTANQLDTFIPITLTVEFIDIDGYLNQFEVPKVILSGSAINAADGQILELTITDSLGLSQSFSVTAFNQQWQLDAVDLQSFAEGELNAVITAATYPGEVTSDTDSSIKDTLAEISIEVDTGNDTVLNAREIKRVDMEGVAKNIEDGQTVTITVTDINGLQLTFTTSVLNGLWQLENKDLSSLAEGPLQFTADSIDVAGNPANGLDEAYKESQAAITIAAIDSDGVLNQVEAGQSVLAGVVRNVEDGRPVEVFVTDINGKTLVFNSITRNGTWLLDGLDLSSLAEGELTLRAITSDFEGNIGTSTNTVLKDTLASVTVEIVDNDAVINSQELQAVKVQGTVSNIEDGQTITVVLTDSLGNERSFTTMVVAGEWLLTDIDLTGFADGSLTATVSVADAAGNQATATDTISVDIFASITIDVDTGNDTVLNAREMLRVDMSGEVTDIEDGQVVTIIVIDNTGQQLQFMATVINGRWQLQDKDLSSLADGPLTFSATATDLAGNTASATDDAYKESQAAITITAIDNDGVLNQTEVGQSVLGGFVYNVEDGRPVEVFVTDINGKTLVFNSITRNGTWLLDGLDLSSLAEGELTLRAITSDFEGNIGTSTNTVLKDTLASVTIEIVDNDAVINSQEQQAVTVRGTVSNVEDGQAITVVLSDGLGNERSFTTVVVAGAWQLSGLDLIGFADGSLTATVSVEDAAGNLATATDTIAVDILASITIDVDTGTDAVINAAEMAMVDLSGTVTDIEAGQTVTVTVTDIDGKTLTFTTMVVGSGWQIDDADLSSLSDGALTFSASAADVAGNVVDATTSADKDSLASITVEIIDNDAVINSLEQQSVTVRGTVSNIEDGQTVIVKLSDGSGSERSFTTVVVAGEWQLSGLDLTGFADGSLTATVSVADAAGNQATATDTINVDILASITIDVDTGNDTVLNAREMLRVDMSGEVTDIEDGQRVSITVTDNAGLQLQFMAIVINGRWQLQDKDLSRLADGPLTFSASVTDQAGNTASATDDAYKESQAAITITAIDNDGVLNQSEVGQSVLGGFVYNVEDGRPVEVFVTDINGKTLVFNSITRNGTWLLDGLDLSSLAEGELTLRAITSDFEGNIGTSTNTVLKDTLASVTIEIVDNDQVINSQEQQAVTVRGTVSNIEDGQTVTVIFSDGSGNDRSFTTVVVAGAWQLSGLDLSGFADGSLTAVVSVADTAGNQATATDTIAVDILASITIEVDTGTDAVINAAEMGLVDLSGIVTDIEAGQAVRVTVTDINGKTLTFTTMVVGAGWQIDDADLSSLSDGALTFSASAADVAGNVVDATTSADKDSLASIAVEIVDDNGLINTAESKDATLAGTVINIENGRPVVITVTDINGKTVTFNSVVVNGAWQVENVDLSVFADGQLSLQATSSDLAGNPAIANNTAVLDTQISIDIDTGADGFDAALFIYGVQKSLSGTTTGVEAGQTVVLNLSDGVNTLSFSAVVAADGSWLFDNMDVAGLNRRASWSLEVTATDLAGNSATDNMPTLLVPDIASLYEVLLNVSSSTSVVVPIDIFDADISITAEQSRLLLLTSEGQALSINVAADGQSFVLTRDGDGKVVMTASLSGTDLNVRLFQPMDELNNKNVLSYIRLSGLQIDADGTSEQIITYAVLNIRDSRAFAFDDHAFVVEDTVAVGSLLGNDYTVEGPLTVTSINYNGIDYPVTAGAAAVINTPQGVITIQPNGSWSFSVADNLNNSVLQEVELVYTVVDVDGSSASANATFTVADGAAGSMADVIGANTEADIDAGVQSTSKTFTVTAGSDTLIADSIRFTALTPFQLANLGLMSNGVALKFELSNNGKTLTAKTDNAAATVVFSITLSASNTGDDLSVDAVFSQSAPLDHLSNDLIEIITQVTATDLDGTDITQGNLTWQVSDGNSPALANISQLTFDENNLIGSAIVKNGSFDVLVGSDAVASVGFAALGLQPKLTAGGETIQYQISADGLTLTGHTGDVNSPVFVIELSETWSATSDSINQAYSFTLYKAFDQTLSEDIDFTLSVADFDGDSSNATLTVTVQDADAATINDINLSVSEIPSITAFDNTATGSFNITASKDPIIDISFNVTDGSEVKNAAGITLTQNGSALYWVVKDGGASLDAVTADGVLVFTMRLPTNIDISAETSGTVELDFKLVSAIDHLGAADVLDTLNVMVNIRDSDNTVSSAEVSVAIYDGQNAILPNALQLNINEGNLTTANPISTSEVLSTSSGSDKITEITLTDSFSFGSVFSGGEKVILNTTANSNGWYVATTETGGDKVFQIRFNANGKVEFRQFKALDHANANGENSLDLVFEVNAIDADNDKSAAQTITVTVKDDIPEDTAKTLEFFESNGDVYSVQMFSVAQQGADGAKVTGITYKGVAYAVGATIELFTDANPVAVKYGELVVDENGLATVTTFEFAYNEQQFNEDVLLQITDADGDIATDTLTIIAKDAEGSVEVFNTQFIEDANTIFGVEARPGDIDESEFVVSMIFDAAALQGGILMLDGVEVPKDADGNYILSILNGLLTEDLLTRVAIPNGDLSYQPIEDGSDATASAAFVITVNITGKPPITTTVPITVESVADTPTWDADSEFSYSVNEDADSFNINVSASSVDETGVDPQGSETVSYIIDNITAGLTLSAIGVTITSGMTISQMQLDNLVAKVGDNLAGKFSFTVQAKTTESDNKDSALSSVETVTIAVVPIADKPTLTTQNIRSDEDAPILLSSVVSGTLTDTSGSEFLSFEFTLPDGWSIDAPSASFNGSVWTVLASEVDSGAAKLIPADDVSSANLGPFSISVKSFATETSQDGVDPADGVIHPNPRYSDVSTVTVTLTGVANDQPVINADASIWAIDSATGVISNVVAFNEDENIALDFTIVSSDDDGSESLDLRITGLPEGVIFVDSAGNAVNLPVVDFINNQPVYGVSASLLATLSLQPASDFSGQISLSIFVQSTELDGDSADYELTLNIDIAPVIDANATSLATVSYGYEDQAIPLDFTPNLNADLDGSETVTGLIIPFQGADGFILTLDGAQVSIPAGGLDVTTLLDSTSPTLEALLNSGRLAAVPPQDADGSFSFTISYQITDTSETGTVVSEYIATEITVVVDAVVDLTTHLQSEQGLLISTDGNAIDLTGQGLFFDGDIDGSEVLDYVVITVPSGDGWYVYHPNGAIDDGDGRWIIPVNGMTSDTVQEYALDLLAGATIISEFATGVEQITVEARVLDRDDAEIISTSFEVQFTQGAGTSQATAVGQLQINPADAIEDTTIDFSGHLNQVLSGDNNDLISFRVLASDLPEGGYFTGSDVTAVYDASGENIIEFVFTSASLGNLKLHNISEDYAGELTIPIRIIATDTVSGDTKIDDSQSLEVEITPVADGVELIVANRVMQEDAPIPLGISLVFDDPDASPTTGGSEQILFGDSNNPITITLLDGGAINDITGLWSLKAGTTDIWEFTGSTMAALNLSLGLLEFVPTEHLSGDFRLKLSATSLDTASINGVDVTDQSPFESTFTIEVTPVTDAANLPSDTQLFTGQEDSLIALSGLDMSSLGLIDQDGSEVIYLTIQGVPTGAVLYFQDGANLVQLPNEGKDGGSFNGSPTFSWAVTPAQLAGLVLQAPLDFSGDIPLSIQAITQELGTADFVTSSADIVVGVSPVADGIEVITAPESQYTSLEDEVINIDLNAKINEFDATELISVKVIISSADASALVGLESIKIGSSLVSLQYDAANNNYFAVVTAVSPVTQLQIFPGDLAFGTLDVQLELTSIDTAVVLGSVETATSTAEVLNFEVEITPEVDAPVWTQIGDITANDVNNVALNLGISLQNPAMNESGILTIYGVPDGMTLSAGSQSGDKWVVNFIDVGSLKIIGAQDGDSFDLTLDPTAVLGTDTAAGDVEVITVTVDAMPTFFSPFTAIRAFSLEDEMRMEEMFEHKENFREAMLANAIKQSLEQNNEPQPLASNQHSEYEYGSLPNDAISRLEEDMALLSQQP